MKILAIDIGTKTGWAHSSGPSGTWDLSVRRDESSGMRLIRLQGKLTDILESSGVDLVVFEAVRNAGLGMQGALVVGAEFQASIKLWCHGHTGIDYRGYSPGEIKRFATGKGNVSKKAMRDAADAKWMMSEGRIEAMDDNEIDAVWLLKLAENEYQAKEERRCLR